jgi:hypothetical protein
MQKCFVFVVFSKLRQTFLISYFTLVLFVNSLLVLTYDIDN